MIIYSNGSGQECLGPLSIFVEGAEMGFPLQVEYLNSNIFCIQNNASISVNISGGNPDYSCQWSTGDTLPNINNLEPGIYYLTVTDAAMCSQVVEIEITLATPDLPQIVLATEEGCNDCTLADTQNTYLFIGAEYMVQVFDLPDQKDLGTIETCLHFDTETLRHLDYLLLQRSWSFRSSRNEAKVYLFTTLDELNTLAQEAGHQNFEAVDMNEFSLAKFDGGNLTPDDYEKVNYELTVDIIPFPLENEVYYVEIPNILFEENAWSRIYLQIDSEPTSTSTTETLLNEDLSFYLQTNPVNSTLTLRTDLTDHKGLGSIAIYNKLGQKVHLEKFRNEILNQKEIIVNDLVAGVYILYIEYTDRKFSQAIKFVKID